MLLSIYVTPWAKREKREEQQDLLWSTSYKIRLSVPPVDGKANEALIRFLSEKFDVPKSRITIVRWHTSRHKIVEIKD